jgi:hypothetical protein
MEMRPALQNGKASSNVHSEVEMADSVIEYLESDLLQVWPRYEGNAAGLRCVKVDGVSLRDDIARKGVLDRLRHALPCDATLWDKDGSLIRAVATVFAATDRFMLIFASHQWPALIEGDIIPELEVSWTVRTRSVIRVDKRHQTVRFENEAEHFVDVVIEQAQ